MHCFVLLRSSHTILIRMIIEKKTAETIAGAESIWLIKLIKLHEYIS